MTNYAVKLVFCVSGLFGAANSVFGQVVTVAPTLPTTLVPVASSQNVPLVASGEAIPVPGVKATHASPDWKGEQPVNWSKVPPIASNTRSGLFTFRSTGSGYYQLLDLLRGEMRPLAPPEPFGLTSVNGIPSYDYDFRFLENPKNTYHPWSSTYKRIHVGDELLFSTGGEMRYRFNNYTNYQLSGNNDSFDLTRFRAYSDLWYRDRGRLFVEMIDARIYNEDLLPAASDRTGTDLLNAFTELKAADLDDSPIQIRAGRQEINLGSQRFIASPDFSNSIRTFDGFRTYWHSPNWNVDAFWVRPVLPNAMQFDSSDDQRAFSGLFLSHRENASTLVDLYLFNLNDTRASTRGDTITFGARFAGDIEKRFLYDFEGAAQTGDSGGRTIDAQAAVAGLGWHFVDQPGNVSFWTYYDYATGTQDPGAGGVNRTFNQLFGGNHAYFGYIDLVGRQNIRDLSFQIESNPQPWVQLRAQYHIFHLDETRDALYNLSGSSIRRDPTGAAGDDVGDEIDLLSNFHLTPHQDFLLGYSRLFAGSFIRATGPGNDPKYFYAQYSFRF